MPIKSEGKNWGDREFDTQQQVVSNQLDRPLVHVVLEWGPFQIMSLAFINVLW